MFVCYIYVSCDRIVSSSAFVVSSDRIVDIEHKTFVSCVEVLFRHEMPLKLACV